ncbi:hypothetical protein AJ85_15990 [Alkalihalobacillus alcalophilus ATCC 27647 = CGMCC 1.3604]|uniref:DNA-binding protein n=1 Tax=Alkalihalobacillus alcalophilus ATCC 27647 = CGMCC 1.3604 TaxID=1218173 RepID=A0A094WCZ8_ALKAL|nr:hypothetical protein [Alkalihalobacillus alcalophilus]KGA95649.1 hypothetical protein BALCAV_0221210 [Alkalihalobacillus alcalophilus ATCC 27647 = CGMCC 1.3604]MED1564002.1 hypothetical protein [Alkalihalobacillus alcalophilus]THG92211.1 hypothetical protein AJ85_15990 [Alkalihalobacillus alcalophilus ATCC 27647 = CGMCC 1.3604]
MNKITVEKTAHILNDLNLCFSEGAVKSLVQRKLLKTSPLEYEERRNSKYNFAISIKSLEDYLKDKGVTAEEFKKLYL